MASTIDIFSIFEQHSDHFRVIIFCSTMNRCIISQLQIRNNINMMAHITILNANSFIEAVRLIIADIVTYERFVITLNLLEWQDYIYMIKVIYLNFYKTHMMQLCSSIHYTSLFWSSHTNSIIALL